MEKDTGDPPIIHFMYVSSFFSLRDTLAVKVLEHSLDALVSRHEGTAIVKDVRGEIDVLLHQLYGKANAGGGAKARNRRRLGDRTGARREVRRGTETSRKLRPFLCHMSTSSVPQTS